MSQLRSILEKLLAFDPNDLSVEELAAEIAEASRGQQILETAVAGWIKNFSDRGGHHTLGYSSPTAFLVHQTGVSPSHARRVIGYGNAPEKAPYAHAAWSDGRLSTDQARYLFAAAEAVPDEYPEAEQKLVDIVEGLDATDTRKAVAYWRQAMEGPGELDPETQQIRRGLSASWLGGMLMVGGCLTRPAGEAFLAGLEANNPPRRDGDARTPRQRRHDALENLCRDWLDYGTTPTVGGEKPHMVVHTDLAALQGIAGGLHETENEDIVDIDYIRMVACDCSLTRIVLGPDSEVLDVGRKTRVWTPAQRRAITPGADTARAPAAALNPATATSTMKTTGPMEALPQSTRANCSADPATSKNTSKTATTDNENDTEPRGEPRALTPETPGQAGTTLILITQWFLPLGRWYSNPARSKRLRVPL